MQRNDILTPPPGSDEAVPLTASGDLRLTNDLPSLRAWVLRAYVVRPGGLLHRPDFGVGVEDFLGESDLGAVSRLQARAKAVIESDRRVASARIEVRADADNPGRTDIYARIDTVDGRVEEALPLEAR